MNDSKDGNIGTLETVSFAFRETKETVSSAFHPLIERNLLVTVGETFHIVSWRKRQYKSDTSTERVKRHRKRSRNVTVTAPDTDTDTDNTLSKDSGEIADFDTQFWTNAKAFFSRHTKNPGALIGKWCRDYPKADVAKAIGAAQVERAVDPIPYVQRVLKKAKQNGWELPIC